MLHLNITYYYLLKIYNLYQRVEILRLKRNIDFEKAKLAGRVGADEKLGINLSIL